MNLTDEIKIPLEPGWNNIAFPLKQCFKINNDVYPIMNIENLSCEVKSIDKVFNSIENQYSLITTPFEVNGGTYNPINKFATNMKYISPGYAYLIRMKEEGGVLKLKGEPMRNPVINLKKGRNHVGYYGSESVDAACAMKELMDDKVLEYVIAGSPDSEKILFYDQEQEKWINNIEKLEPFMGYFIKVKEDFSWEQKEITDCE